MAVFKAQEAIVKAYNKMTGKALTVVDVIFGTPTMIPEGIPRNARVKVYPKAHTLETTILPITYNKIHVSELGVIKVLKGSRFTTHEVLDDIKTTYEYELTITDVINTALGGVDADGYCVVDLQFEPGCLGYYSGTKIVTPIVLNPETIEKMDIDKLAIISSEFSSYNAVVFGKGRECHSSRLAAVRSDFGITAGVHYWEVKLHTGGAIIGICARSAPVDYTGNNRIGSTNTTWGLDTSTGKFMHNGSEVVLTRAILPGEWVGISFNKATGQIRYFLKDLNYTVATNAHTLPEVFASISGNAEVRSVFGVNLGGEPMVLTVPAGIKHGIYTLKVPGDDLGYQETYDAPIRWVEKVTALSNGTVVESSITIGTYGSGIEWATGGANNQPVRNVYSEPIVEGKWYFEIILTHNWGGTNRLLIGYQKIATASNVKIGSVATMLGFGIGVSGLYLYKQSGTTVIKSGVVFPLKVGMYIDTIAGTLTLVYGDFTNTIVTDNPKQWRLVAGCENISSNSAYPEPIFNFGLLDGLAPQLSGYVAGLLTSSIDPKRVIPPSNNVLVPANLYEVLRPDNVPRLLKFSNYLLKNNGILSGLILETTYTTNVGKYYFEVTPSTVYTGLRLGLTSDSVLSLDIGGIYNTPTRLGISLNYNNTPNKAIGILLDFDTRKVKLVSTLVNTGDAGVAEYVFPMNSRLIFVYNNLDPAISSLALYNFGQVPFQNAVPAGYHPGYGPLL